MGLVVVAELLGVGAVAGGLGALLGVGGGIILVPALLFISGLPIHTAVGTSLVCVVATSVAGSAVQFSRRQVDIAPCVQLQFFAVMGAVAMGLVAHRVPGGFVYVAFAALLLVAAWRNWPGGTPRATSGSHGDHMWVASAGSLAAGGVSSLLGVGGGIVFTPLLHLVVGLDFHKAVATSIYLIGVTAGSGALVYFVRGDVAPAVAAPTMLGVLVGATVASTVLRRIDATWLKRAFAILLVYVAIRMALRGIHGG
jgi:uncharacterized membrane protein YfcA